MGGAGTKTGELATFPAQGHLGFQGQLTDALTGQVDMLTRNYEPTIGRFDTRDVLFGDTADPVMLNQSVYAGDAPITNSDPTGMFVIADGGGSSPAVSKSQAEQPESPGSRLIERLDVRALYMAYGQFGPLPPWCQSPSELLDASTSTPAFSLVCSSLKGEGGSASNQRQSTSNASRSSSGSRIQASV